MICLTGLLPPGYNQALESRQLYLGPPTRLNRSVRLNTRVPCEMKKRRYECQSDETGSSDSRTKPVSRKERNIKGHELCINQLFINNLVTLVKICPSPFDLDTLYFSTNPCLHLVNSNKFNYDLETQDIKNFSEVILTFCKTQLISGGKKNLV